jgi:hypothetical protein
MESQLRWKCDQHAHPEDCPDCIVKFYLESGKFGLLIHDGGSSYIEIQFCPWCGADLGTFMQATSVKVS